VIQSRPQAVAILVIGLPLGIRLISPRGDALVRDAEHWLTGQGVVDPRTFSAVFLPGLDR